MDDIGEEKSLNQSIKDNNNLNKNIDIDDKSNELENQILNDKIFSPPLGKDLLKIKENNNIINSKLTYGFLEDKLIQVVDDHLFYNNFEFYKVKQYYKKINNTNNNKICYR